MDGVKKGGERGCKGVLSTNFFQVIIRKIIFPDREDSSFMTLRDNECGKDLQNFMGLQLLTDYNILATNAAHMLAKSLNLPYPLPTTVY